jgi:hypothetical protein
MPIYVPSSCTFVEREACPSKTIARTKEKREINDIYKTSKTREETGGLAGLRITKIHKSKGKTVEETC